MVCKNLRLWQQILCIDLHWHHNKPIWTCTHWHQIKWCQYRKIWANLVAGWLVIPDQWALSVTMVANLQVMSLIHSCESWISKTSPQQILRTPVYVWYNNSSEILELSWYNADLATGKDCTTKTAEVNWYSWTWKQ